MRVTTVVLNYRNVDDTLRCVASLRRSTVASSLVVVDNGATEETRARFASELPEQTVVHLDANDGYAAGNNVGLRIALERDADAVWVLNPDTTVAVDALERQLEALERRPDVGVLGARILNGHDGGTIWFDGGTIDWATLGTAHVHAGARAAEVPAGETPVDVDYVTGASMLVRRPVLERVGLLPERYFLYYEETDFNLRARAEGFGIAVARQAVVTHYQRSYEALPSVHYIYYYVRNRLLFAAEHAPHLTADAVESGVRAWSDGWRTKVARHAPGWLDVFDALVDAAVADGRLGREGKVDLTRFEEPRSER